MHLHAYLSLLFFYFQVNWLLHKRPNLLVTVEPFNDMDGGDFVDCQFRTIFDVISWIIFLSLITSDQIL